MPSANDLRKTLTDPTPLYFAAGVIDKIREEAPQRIAAARDTDPRAVQDRVAQQAKETQAKVTEALGEIDTDIKKLREQAQHLALQSVGLAAEYAVRARETYDELSVRGREAVRNWRGEDHGPEPDESLQVTVERQPVKVAEPPHEPPHESADGPKDTVTENPVEDKSGENAENAESKAEGKGTGGAKAKSGAAKKTGTARKATTTRKSAPKSQA
ncbi:hypothetical protein [Streptomyces boncukensis]|uniref:Heparin binding hemagglutinin HbhA n=1 Tax=Streptomyces boncukensis TaxID=2711219 RepID=A0A6G4WUJ6_9ACTN|nr:hypothetical protein [Streptomyces boncukensis]NGO68959.1 hypothetical protein [Streptomyces boncukensis]